MRKLFILLSSFLLLLQLKAQNGGTSINLSGAGFINCSSANSYWTTKTSNITFEAWINWDGTSANQIIIANGDTGQDGYFVYLDTNSDIICANSAAGGYTFGNSNLSANQWYHIAAILTATTGEWDLYINGVLQTPTSTNSSINAPGSQSAAGRSVIGANNSGGEIFNGIIDEVRIWNDVRSQAEIRQNMFRELDGTEADLIAYYNLNDASGTTADNLEGTTAFDGTLNGTSSWVTSGAFAGSRKALEFDPSTNDGVNLGSSTDLKLQTTAFSVSVWLYRHSEGRQQILNNGISGSVNESWWLAFGNNSNFGSSVSEDKTLVFGFDPTQADGNDKVEVRSTSEFPLNKWVNVTGTYDGTNLKIYINGVLEKTQSASSQPWDNSSFLYLCRQAGRPDIDFDGAIDELSIWNKTLSQVEILDLMTGTLSGDEAGLIGYWRLDEEDGTSAYDLTSNENTGTYVGSPTVTSSSAFNTWIGGTSGSWSEAKNWSSGSAPSSTDNVGLTNYTNSNAPAVSGSPTVNNFILGSGVTATLFSGITVNETLGLTDTDLDLNGQTITLGPDAVLIEHTGITVTGTSGSITTTRSLNNISAENVAGLGAMITTSANMGSTDITRTHSEYTEGANKSILRAYNIDPTTNTGLNATLLFTYDDSELNGLTESDLILFKSTNSGTDWTNEGGTVNTGDNTIEVTGLDGFSLWTAAESSSPLPVELTYFEGTATEEGVLLEWETATEVNNYGFEVEREKGGNGEWEMIGFVEGHGNTNSPKQYSFTDPLNFTLNPNLTFINYRLKQIDNDGTFEYSKVITVDLTNITSVDDEIEYEFALEQNYPNPFNPSTNIQFSLPESRVVNVSVYNVIGEKVDEIVNEKYERGIHKVQWNASNQPSGVYFIRLNAGDFNSVKKAVLVK